MSGRVEICFNETWGTICDSFWTTFDGNVACRQLGFSKRGTYAGCYRTIGLRMLCIPFISYDNIAIWCDVCHTDPCIVLPLNCGINRLFLAPAHACLLLVVKRKALPLIQCNFDIDLFQFGRTWLCSNGHIICNFISSGASVQRDSFYGPGVGPIYLGSLQCIGEEVMLTQCSGGSTASCTHQSDAGVVCQPSKFLISPLSYMKVLFLCFFHSSQVPSSILSFISPIHCLPSVHNGLTQAS